jgi:hypothetical protein
LAFESPRESGNPSHRGAGNKDGRGTVLGGHCLGGGGSAVKPVSYR